jgi:hypothetical protein
MHAPRPRVERGKEIAAAPGNHFLPHTRRS